MSFNRNKYFDYINERLATLATAIEISGKLNILNLHHHAENFYRDFFNNLYDWQLKNLNDVKQNAEAIDLVCDSNKLIIQVSASCTKDKIESTLEKQVMNDYKDHYCFKFITISKSAKNIRKNKFKNPLNVTFNPLEDIYDLESILKAINSLKIDKQKELYEFIKKELGQETDLKNLDSNLSTIINILSKEDLDDNQESMDIDIFEIDRKISFNNLKSAKLLIEDHRIHHNRIDKIYSEYDMSGVNKSSSVFNSIRAEYIKNVKIDDDDKLFFKVIDNVKNKIINSPNLIGMPIDELELCINILVVDAFIRCKIFKNPSNYKYAITR